jgi:hypothetical protein
MLDSWNSNLEPRIEADKSVKEMNHLVISVVRCKIYPARSSETI